MKLFGNKAKAAAGFPKIIHGIYIKMGCNIE
jgi:hypothetical protein